MHTCMHTEAGDVITGITDHKPTMRESMTNYCLALQERNIRKLVEGKGVFNILETEKEGILGATKLYPGVIIEFFLYYNTLQINTGDVCGGTPHRYD